MSTPAPTTIRLPPDLRQRVRERAALEHRSVSNQIRLLLESALAAATSPDPDPIDEAETERLATLARQTIQEHAR